ncbi:MAG: hypothetical protein ACNA78_05100 [Balneolaceae bacterium]
MKQYLHILYQKKTESGTPLWSFTISGNMVELRTMYTIDSDPENYRQGVIDIGSVLASIRAMCGEAKSRPSIQVFPNMMDSRLVATIRFSRTQPSGHPQPKRHPLPNGLPATLSLRQKLMRLAESYELIFTEVNNTHLKPFDLLQKPSCTPFFLGSKGDNPFVWLLVGGWAEEAISYLDRSSELHPKGSIHPLVPEELRGQIKESLQLTFVPQFLICI